MALRSLLVQLFTCHTHSTSPPPPLQPYFSRRYPTRRLFFFALLFSRFLHNNSAPRQRKGGLRVYRDKRWERDWKSIFQKRFSNHFFCMAVFAAAAIFFLPGRQAPQLHEFEGAHVTRCGRLVWWWRTKNGPKGCNFSNWLRNRRSEGYWCHCWLRRLFRGK